MSFSKHLLFCLAISALIAAQASISQSNSQLIPPIFLLLEDEPTTRFEQVIEAYNQPNSDSKHIFIAAHRGGKEQDRRDRAPGNSIENIANAVSKEFDIYESDIEILLGNGKETFVVFHDNTFNNLTNTSRPNDRLDDADLSYAKTLRLTYDDGSVSEAQIPTLREFLLAAKDQIMVKFDLKSGVFSAARLTAIFNIIQETGTQEQVLIRGGDFLLNTAKENGYDTNIIMRRYNSEPSLADLTQLTDNFDVKAISIPNGASAEIVQAARARNLIVEIHESQGVSDQQRQIDWEVAIGQGIRQFHSFKPTLLRDFLEACEYREF